MRTEPRWACILLVALLVACSTRTENLASSTRPLDGGEQDDDAEVDVDPDGGPVFSFDAGIAYCGDELCACSNRIDDDEDGFIDGLDPECTGPFDDSEEHFGTGRPGENSSSRCQGCYFDKNPGRAGDACRRPRSCATNNNASGGNGACSSCDIDEGSACVANCEPLVPNGCDCFGCCEVYRDGSRRNVLLSSSCDMDNLDDPAACEPCIPSLTCRNTCERCELCPGRTVTDLPRSCAASGPGYLCDGSDPCESSSDCPGFAYCLLGCCLPVGI